MPTILENANPNRNPFTAVMGILFMSVSAGMFIVKYLVPAFVVLKQEIPYEWYLSLVPLGVGLILFFMNDNYFGKIFERFEKIVGKKTDT
jgi:hypothetical protein